MQECVWERTLDEFREIFGGIDFSYVHSSLLIMYGFCFITQINKSVSTIEGEPAKTENSKDLGLMYMNLTD